ncbi:MAG TPA: hypothetical protein G4O10_04875 [Dehalococcoidia bacterium]|nr:hypothetical protein [Dehalococcoidia bacterium]
MSWQALVIIGGILAGLAFLGMLFWLLSKRSRKRLIHQTEVQLVEHLRSIGVKAEIQKVKRKVVRTREDGYPVILRQLVTTNVWLRGIQSIEIWQVTRKGEEKSTTLDEISYMITPEPGMTLYRIPILTNIVTVQTADGKTEFEWRGFEWGRLPLLVDRLRTDRNLNSRLLRHFYTNLPDNLRITASSGDKIGITMSYNQQQLPSRELLTCIEDIASHVCDYVAERNSARKQEEGKAQQDDWTTDISKAGNNIRG